MELKLTKPAALCLEQAKHRGIRTNV